MNRAFGLIFLILFLIIGIVFVTGTKKRLLWLGSPPKMFYGHYILLKYFGQKFLIYYNYFIGIIFILIGLFGILNELRHIF